MPSLAINPGLRAGTRLAPLASSEDRMSLAEMATLITAGFVAAVASGLIDLDLKMPGHAILKPVLPLALGLALVPRRLGGAVMGASAAATLLGLRMAGAASVGAGALTSLCLIGPLLDVALWRTRPGWSIYLRFALAGLAANMAAFALKGSGKYFLALFAGDRPLRDWLTIAPVSYAFCGLVAGLISAAVWFRLNRRPPQSLRCSSEPEADG